MPGTSTKVSLNRDAIAAIRAHQRRLALEWEVEAETITVSAVVLHLSGRRIQGAPGASR